MTTLSNVFEYDHILNTHFERPKNIIVVGAGGTGGYLIPNLARQVALQNQLRSVEGLQPHMITIIEGDTVELKNLTRQNFIEQDIDKNKGQVVAERYGGAFGVTINFVQEYVQSVGQMETIIQRVRQASQVSMATVIVDCVDNNKTRMILLETARRNSNNGNDTYFLSSGNEEWSGQVVCTSMPRHVDDRRRDYDPSRMPEDGSPRKFRTPLLTEMFPEVKDAEDKLPTELSCAERAVSAPQNILTNMTAANLLFTFLNTILTAREADGQGLKHFAVMFDAQNSVFRTVFNKASEIKKYVG